MIYMNKIINNKFMLLLSFIFLQFFLFNTVCYASEMKTLILYDQSRVYGNKENILNELIKLKLSNDNEIEFKKLDLDTEVNTEELNKYDEIYVLEVSRDADKKLKLNEHLNNINEQTNYIDEELFNNNNLKNNENTEFYYYLNDVTPFDDLNVLIEKIDYLKDNGIKCFIETTPVFINENLDAMKKFCETLRYAQSCGDKVVLNFPVINNKGARRVKTNGQIINEKLKTGFINYINYWVYPVALSAEDNILYEEDLKDTLSSTDTLFLNKEDNLSSEIYDDGTVQAKKLILKMSINDYLESSYKANDINNSKACAICINDDDIDKFKENLKAVMKRGQYKNINSDNLIESSIGFDDYKINNYKSGITFKGNNVTQNRFISDEEFEKAFNEGKPEQKSNIKISLTKSNKIILIISFISLSIFVIILIISKNIERKKFFK